MINQSSFDSPKIFVSFLGTGIYQETSYNFGDSKQSEPVRFIQTATSKFNPCNGYLVFCTQRAKDIHWNSLCGEFAKEGLPEPKCIDIPTGQKEEELWEIFDIICGEIPVGSKLVFDITHSLRCFPVLTTILFNFLKVIKDVKIEKCLYGAWEAKKENEGFAPVFDLTPFFVLNDWSQAVSLLEKTGNASEINKIIKTEREFFRKPDNEIEVNIDNLSKVTNAISELTLNIAACRGDKIKKADINDKFDAIRDETVKNLFPPFATIYARLKDEFKKYKRGNLMNGFLAARWCDKYNLIPQRNTILQETIISIFEEKFYGNYGPDKEIRKKIRGEISHYLQDRSKKHKIKEGLPDSQIFSDKFRKLSDQRNDVNHAGFGRVEPRDIKTLKNLEEDIDFFEETINKYVPTPFIPSKIELLVGNSFPISLIRRNVKFIPQEKENFPASAEIYSFWGHENTLRVASDFLKVDLTPKTKRPVLELSQEGLPMLDKKEFTECWIISPNYTENFRPETGVEVSAEKIRGWTILKVIWEQHNEPRE